MQGRYDTQNLIRGEEILHQGRVHWIVFAPSATYLLLAVIIALGPLSALTGLNLGLDVIAVVVLLWSGYALLLALVAYFTTELTITNRRVISKRGLIRRSTVELNHRKVESVLVDQSVLGRMLNFGTLSLVGAGGTSCVITAVADPYLFRARALETIDSLDQ